MIFKKTAVLLLSASCLLSACAREGADDPVGSNSAPLEELVSVTYDLADVDIQGDPGACFEDGELSACIAGSDAQSQLASDGCAITDAEDCGPNGCTVCAVIGKPSVVARASNACFVEDCNDCGRYCNPCICFSTF